jgi:hypothetical protein
LEARILLGKHKGDGMEKPNYYRVLGTSLAASQKEITQAYRRLALRFHPDRQPPGQKQWAGEQMKRLNEAYAVLGDPEARARYDAGAGLQFRAPPYEEKKRSAPFAEGWFADVPFYTTGKSRRWHKFAMMADFLFWMLVMYFLIIGAYLIFVEWELLHQSMLVIGAEQMLEFKSQELKFQWTFTAIWYFVLLLTLLKAVPTRR